jgi:hypothetical protein
VVGIRLGFIVIRTMFPLLGLLNPLVEGYLPIIEEKPRCSAI